MPRYVIKKQVVAGLGEIGLPILKLLSKSTAAIGYDIDESRMNIKKFPHPRSPQAIDIIAKRWGTVSGFNAAEAFCLVRKLQK